jgi:hypothetical protein
MHVANGWQFPRLHGSLTRRRWWRSCSQERPPSSSAIRPFIVTRKAAPSPSTKPRLRRRRRRFGLGSFHRPSRVRSSNEARSPAIRFFLAHRRQNMDPTLPTSRRRWHHSPSLISSVGQRVARPLPESSPAGGTDFKVCKAVQGEQHAHQFANSEMSWAHSIEEADRQRSGQKSIPPPKQGNAELCHPDLGGLEWKSQGYRAGW